MSDRQMAAIEPRPPRRGRRWYRSLYWRFAGGLVAFLALMLIAEAALFISTTDHIAGARPAKNPRQLARLVAEDLSAAIAADPRIDLERYVRDQYGQVLQGFVVMMRDGRTVSNLPHVPADVLQVAREENEIRDRNGPRWWYFNQNEAGSRGRPFGPRSDRPFGTGEFVAPGALMGRRLDPADGSTAPPRRPPYHGEFARILVDGRIAGRVIVLPDPPSFSRVLRQFGPKAGVVAGGMLGIGTAVIALVVFGPARQRLKHVQDAAERLGSGDLAARAPEHGGDEVAALAQSFNRMAEELTLRATALDASDQARRQLLADVSHELMTPLTAMRGYIETLGMSELMLDDGTRQHYLAIVTEETHRLERIIGDLLDLARLEGGGMTLRREDVPITTLFARIATRHAHEISARHIQLTQTVEPDAMSVHGDADRLEQALQNLAANALRHTPDAGTIQLHATRRGAHVHIAVRDSGPGIAPQHLPLIFDRFYKVDAARKAVGGSGLGLSIVKAIVEQHGGTISARNEAGAVFEILLPV